MLGKKRHHSCHIYSEKKELFFSTLNDINVSKLGNLQKKSRPKCHPRVEKVAFSQNLVLESKSTNDGLELATFCPETCLTVGWFWQVLQVTVAGLGVQ